MHDESVTSLVNQKRSIITRRVLLLIKHTFSPPPFFVSFPYFYYYNRMETIIDQDKYNLFMDVLGNLKDKAPRECVPLDDKTTLFISSFLCVGLVISYLPQVKKQ